MTTIRKLNLNTILAILGGLGVFAPDVASVAAGLASLGVAWLAMPIKILGFLATFCAAAPRVVPKLRAFLALFGLATPPGAVAPWVPGKPGDPALQADPAAPLAKVEVTPVTVPNPGRKAGG